MRCWMPTLAYTIDICMQMDTYVKERLLAVFGFRPGQTSAYVRRSGLGERDNGFQREHEIRRGGDTDG